MTRLAKERTLTHGDARIHGGTPISARVDRDPRCCFVLERDGPRDPFMRVLTRGEVRRVAFLREVQQHEVLTRLHARYGVGAELIAEVPRSSHDAFLEVRGSPRCFLHVGTVVGFNCEGVYIAEVFDESRRDSAAVGRVSEVCGLPCIVVEHETEARDSERIVREDFGKQAKIRTKLVLVVEGFGLECEQSHAFGASEVSSMNHELGAEVAGTDRADPSCVAVIRIEVRVDDRVHFIGTDTTLREQRCGSAWTQSRIDQVDSTRRSFCARDNKHAAVPS